MNEIERIYPFTRWRPTYFFRVDEDKGDWISSTQSHIRSEEKCFVAERFVAMLGGSPVPLVLCPEHPSTFASSSNKPRNWHLPVLCRYGSGLSVMMQVAIQMGYTELRLVACDIGADHFDPDYLPSSDPEREETLLDMHEIAARETKSMGVLVLNATIGGKLEVYPRIDPW